MKRTAAIVLGCAVAALALIPGCDGGGSAPPAPAPAPAGGGAAPAGAAPAPSTPSGGGAYDPASATATIVVKATAKGELPKMRPMKFDADPVCDEQHKAAEVLEQSIVASGGKLANVIAWASRGAEGKTYATPAGAVTLDQKGCMYQPHVFSLMVNQPITIRNSDPTMHNIHAVPKTNEQFNKSQIKGARDLTQKFAKEEVPVKIKCDVHGWMLAWAGVFSHPFHGVTGDDGTTILKVPPGDYEISAWQESDKLAQPAAQKVTVGKGETKKIEFVFDVK